MLEQQIDCNLSRNVDSVRNQQMKQESTIKNEKHEEANQCDHLISEKNMTQVPTNDNTINPSACVQIDSSDNKVSQSQLDDSGSELSVDKTRYKSSKDSRNVVELRLLVRRREAGALIGKRGANIKRLREQFKESAFNIPDTGNGPERVVCLSTCSSERLEEILLDVTNLFQEKQTAQSARLSHIKSHLSPSCQSLDNKHTIRINGDQIEIKLLINSSHAGLLIGVGGQSIRKLRNDSRAAIKIYEMCCPLSSERVCAIKAKPPVVVAAIKMIYEIVAANPIKGTHKAYDALNFNLSLVDKYGGFTIDDECYTMAPSPSQISMDLEMIQHLQSIATNSMFPSQSAHILQNQAAQLLAAAASVAATSRVSNGSHLKVPISRARLRFNPNGAPTNYCEKYPIDKYQSIIKAGQEAIVAGRFRPYFVPSDHSHDLNQSTFARQFMSGDRVQTSQQHSSSTGAMPTASLSTTFVHPCSCSGHEQQATETSLNTILQKPTCACFPFMGQQQKINSLQSPDNELGSSSSGPSSIL